MASKDDRETIPTSIFILLQCHTRITYQIVVTGEGNENTFTL